MLKKVTFQNYRCFRNSSLTLKELSILVGKNNAGKSTVIEALRLIALAGNKAKNSIFRYPTASMGLLQSSQKGFALNVDKLKIDLRAVVHFYEEDTNAVISATFDNKATIEIHINKMVVFVFLKNPDGDLVTTKSAATKCNFDNIQILPQIGLIKENEKLLSRDTVVADRDTYLSSRHFRNELLLYKKEYFDDFTTLAEDTWPSLRIRDLEINNTNAEISLLIEDTAFTAEIGIMGSGIQMWLQIIWFICRSKDCDTIILDEPDVYMHPDLQRKLIKFLLPRFKQIVIATHSVEIISEVEPRHIAAIDKVSRSMSYANSKKSVQEIISSIGSVHNLALVRIANQGKCIFVEGNDIKILDKLYSRLFPYRAISLATYPNIALGGWKNFHKALGISQIFHGEADEAVKCYCILDRDYYLPETLTNKKKLADEHHLKLHIWNKKEIENYLIIPDVLFRISKAPREQYDDFMHDLESLVDAQKDEVVDQFSNQYHQMNKSQGTQNCNKLARAHVAQIWTTLESKINIIPGKELLHKINQWLSDKFSQSCSITTIIKNINPDEIDNEITEFFKWLIP